MYLFGLFVLGRFFVVGFLLRRLVSASAAFFLRHRLMREQLDLLLRLLLQPLPHRQGVNFSGDRHFVGPIVRGDFINACIKSTKITKI